MISEDTLEKFRQKSSEMIAEIERRQALLKEKLSQRSATTPQPGDIFFFKHPKTLGIQWAILHADAQNPQHFLAVPADDTPMVGSTDVELPKSALCSPLTLRCDYSLSIDKDKFDMNLRVGVLEERHRLRASDKITQISEKNVRSSISQQETDDDPDYVEWMEQVYQAREVLTIKENEVIKALINFIKVLNNLYKKLVILLPPEKMVPVTLATGIILGIIVNYPFYPEVADNNFTNDFFNDEIDTTKPILTKGASSLEEQPSQENPADLAQLPPDEWVDKIIDKIREGDTHAAEELLRQFNAKYPNYRPDE